MRERTGSLEYEKDRGYVGRVTIDAYDLLGVQSRRPRVVLGTHDEAEARRLVTELNDGVRTGRLVPAAREVGRATLKHFLECVPPITKPPTTSGVYVVMSIGRIKIGYGSSVAGRVRSLQTGNPMPIVLLAVAPGTMATEAELHRRFAGHQTIGEWFRITERMLEWVREVRMAMPATTVHDVARMNGWTVRERQKPAADAPTRSRMVPR